MARDGDDSSHRGHHSISGMIIFMPYRTREEFLDARVAELEAEVRDLKRDRLHAAMKRAERLCIVVGAAAFSGAGVLGAMLFVW